MGVGHRPQRGEGEEAWGRLAQSSRRCPVQGRAGRVQGEEAWGRLAQGRAEEGLWVGLREHLPLGGAEEEGEWVGLWEKRPHAGLSPCSRRLGVACAALAMRCWKAASSN